MMAIKSCRQDIVELLFLEGCLLDRTFVLLIIDFHFVLFCVCCYLVSLSSYDLVGTDDEGLDEVPNVCSSRQAVSFGELVASEVETRGVEPFVARES